MKKLRLAGLLSLVLVTCLLHGQAPTTSRPMDQAYVKHGSQSATVTANSARPLDQTIEAMREVYGWILDYEDPVYSGTDLTEITDQDWPTDKHPQITPGLKRPAGGPFTTTYPESPNMDTDQSRSSVLKQVLADYAKSGNPAKFVLIQTAPSRFDIVGLNESSPPVFDTLVAINAVGESASRALYDVFEILQTKTGHKWALGRIPTNDLLRCSANPEIQQGSARTVILSILDSCHRSYTYRLLYDNSFDLYVLNIMARLPPPASNGKP